MLSNSKLDKFAKAERKDMLRNLPAGATLHSDPDVGITILAVPDGSVTRVFSSVASRDERKFRRKVGEFHALRRFFRDADGGMLLRGFWTAAVVADAVGWIGD